jgi:hypothetical protein
MGELAILCLETNASGKVRREKYDGRDFLVVPVVAQVAGVVNRELATAEELGKFPGAWEGIPIVTTDHPMKKGIAVSARTKDQLPKSIGWLFNTSVNKKGKLKGEIWLDINKANAMGGDAKRAVDTLENGGKTEVSTAYFRDVEKKSGTFKGKKYESVAHNLRPDHLAILFDQPGACNWKEGCGAPRTNQEQSMEAARRAIADAWHARQRKRNATLLPEERMLDFWLVETFADHIIVRAGAEFFKVAYEQLEDGTFSFADKGKWEKVKEKKEWIAVNIRSKARRPSFKGTETTSWGSVNKSFDAYRDGYFKHTGAHPPDDPVTGVANAPQAMKTWIASKSLLGDAQAATFADLLFFPVVNASTNNLNRGALVAVTGGRGAQAKIPAAAKTSAQNMARSLLKSQYKVKGNALVILSALGAIGLDALWPVKGEKQEDIMDRDQMIQTLLACNHCKFTQEQLDAMEDDSLQHLATMAQEMATLQANAEQDDGDQDAPPEADPPEAPPETNAAPPAVPPELQPLVEMVERLGGVERLESMITSNADQEAQERAEIVGRLKVNELCAFSEDELNALTMATLRKVDASLVPANYGGRYLPPTSNVGKKPKGAPEMPAVLLAQPANSQN